MKIAVTGAAGHVGNNLCRALVAEGYEVRALIHKDLTSLDQIKVFKVHGDVLDPASLEQAFSGVDAVFHLAGKISVDGDRDGRVTMVNVEGTKNVVEACLSCHVKKMIHFSASHVFQQDPLDEELDERRAFVGASAFPYERSKWQAEAEVQKGIQKGLHVVTLHPTSIMGPYDYKPSLVGKALVDLYNGQLGSLIPGGFDWVDVRDIVASSIEALKKGRPGERYLLSGTWITTRELTELVTEITGKKAPKFTSPVWLAKVALPFAKVYSKVLQSPPVYTKEAIDVLLNSNPKISSKKAKTELGHSCRPLKETVQDTYEWFKQRGVIL